VTSMPDSIVTWWQLSRLNYLVKLSFESVPFYADLFQKFNISPNTARLKGMSSLPIVTKAMLKASPLEKLISNRINIESVDRVTTLRICRGDGIPFRLWQDKILQRGYQNLFRNFFSGKSTENQRFLIVTPIKRLQFFQKNVLFFPQTRFFKDKAGFLRILQEFRPQQIAFESLQALSHTAELLSQKEPAGNLTVENVVGFLPSLVPTTREKLNNMFGCRIFLAMYPFFHEVPFLGWECNEHDGFHLDQSSYIAEIVDKQGNPLGPGKRGRIVVTKLDNEVMPLVRYDTGDLGFLAERGCRCGNQSPRLFIETHSNVTALDFSRLGSVLAYYHSAVEKFEIVQDGNSLNINILPGRSWNDAFLEHLKGSLHKEFGGNLINTRITIKYDP